jgi:hypothetical protein
VPDFKHLPKLRNAHLIVKWRLPGIEKTWRTFSRDRYRSDGVQSRAAPYDAQPYAEEWEQAVYNQMKDSQEYSTGGSHLTVQEACQDLILIEACRNIIDLASRTIESKAPFFLRPI